MSAAEKLKGLDETAVPSPWLAEDDGKTLLPFVENVAGNREDRAVIAALRNALPQIVAVVQAVEQLQLREFESGVWYDVYESLPAALAALDEQLTGSSPPEPETPTAL